MSYFLYVCNSFWLLKRYYYFELNYGLFSFFEVLMSNLFDAPLVHI